MIWLRRRIDWVASLFLVAVIGFYAWTYVDFNVPPYEDAAMLMRYADHVAHGYGIVWNIGQHPVDGATDFLFMEAAAALIRAGVAVGRSIRVLGFASHVLTVLLVYWANRKLWNAGVLVSFVGASYLAVGTGLSYVAAFFGAPFFALWAVVAWVFALLLIRAENAPPGLAWLFAISALLTGLSRPEGVILAAAMLAAIVVLKGWHASESLVLIFAGVFLILGGAYFIWHWSYFGYPLPNPFYKKGGGSIYLDSFWESLGNLLRFGGPFLLAFLLGLRSRRTIRTTMAFGLPLLVFAAAFILISNETNFGGRFQYALWPMVLICYYPLVRDLKDEIHVVVARPASPLARAVWILVGLCLVDGLMRHSLAQSCTLTIAQQSCGVAYEADGRYDLAKVLSEYSGHGYVMATSEAGLLPLYSSWSAIDAWGLNDEWIAHHGEVTAEYLDQFKPNVIAFHAYFSPLIPPKITPRNLSQEWFRMTITLKNYAEAHGYTLAAAFGDSPYETHYYYVRPDFPDSDKLVHDISGMKNYYWFGTGRKAINYALIQP
jgi:hypothetical protein